MSVSQAEMFARVRLFVAYVQGQLHNRGLLLGDPMRLAGKPADWMRSAAKRVTRSQYAEMLVTTFPDMPHKDAEDQAVIASAAGIIKGEKTFGLTSLAKGD